MTAIDRPADHREADGYASFLDRRYFGALDGLRALAIIAVIWHHTRVETYGGLSARGEYGVDLFFAISGFLITTLLLRERRAKGRISLRNFYVRRTLRIFPLYYAVLALYVVLTFVLRRDTPEGQQFFANLPAFATYTSNWFVDFQAGVSTTFYFAWTLATEEQFYLFWPGLLVLLLALRPRRLSPAVLPALALLALCAASVVGWVLRDQVGFADAALWVRILASLAVPILCGALLALVVDRPRGYAAVAPVLARPWSPVVLALVVAVAVVADLHRQALGVLLAVLVTSLCLREDGPLFTVLAWRPLKAIGVVSYGMYLMHMLAVNLVEAGLSRLSVGPGPVLFALSLPVVYVAAYLSYRYFESPILALKKRFA